MGTISPIFDNNLVIKIEIADDLDAPESSESFTTVDVGTVRKELSFVLNDFLEAYTFTYITGEDRYAEDYLLGLGGAKSILFITSDESFDDAEKRKLGPALKDVAEGLFNERFRIEIFEENGAITFTR